MNWIWIILTLLYLLSPVDIIPGFHPVGWLDDIIILVMLLRYLFKFRKTGQSSWNNHQYTRRHSETGGTGTTEKKYNPPHEVLGVSPNADHKQIRSAYRKLANQYHPDKVAHLGKEFQSLAEKRFKEIQKAYDQLTPP